MKSVMRITRILASIGLGCLLLSCKAPPNDACLTAPGGFGSKAESQCVQLQFQGKTRTYRVYAPHAGTGRSQPLLLVLHGGGGSGSAMEGLTFGQFNRIADRDGVIVVYPDGIGRSWNDGRAGVPEEATEKNSDDVGYLRAVVGDVSRHLAVDHARVYATGISNGGFMSYRLACEASDFVAAVAPVAANLSVDLAGRCHPRVMTPIAIIDGTDDPLVPWKGGDVKVLWSHRGAIYSAPETFAYWRELGGCGLPVTQMRDAATDGTSVVKYTAHCKGGGEARLYEVRSGGHNWPGGAKYLSEFLVGKVSHAMNASDEVWNFVSRFSLRR
jgi:polyhydroxybutyrate depolymerase